MGEPEGVTLSSEPKSISSPRSLALASRPPANHHHVVPHLCSQPSYQDHRTSRSEYIYQLGCIATSSEDGDALRLELTGALLSELCTDHGFASLLSQALTFGLQGAFAVPAIIQKSEKNYDVSVLEQMGPP